MAEIVKINRSLEELNALGRELGELREYFQDILEKEFVLSLVKEIKSLCRDLSIPIISRVEELNPDSIVIFPSYHEYYEIEPPEIKKILYQKLNSDKKTILGFEFFSDKSFEDLLNDPTRNLNDTKYLSNLRFRKIIWELIKVFNEIQKKYPIDRFEIKVFGMTYAEFVEMQKAKNKGDTEKVKELSEKSNAHKVKSILDYLSKYVDNNLVFWTGMLHVIGLLTKLKESGDKEGIKIDKIVVFLPPSYQSLSDYEQRKLKLLNEVISILRK